MPSVSGDVHLPERETSYSAVPFSSSPLYDGFRQDVGKHIASVDLLQPKVALGNAVLYPVVLSIHVLGLA